MQKNYSSDTIVAVTRKGGQYEAFIKSYVNSINANHSSTPLKIRWVTLDEKYIIAETIVLASSPSLKVSKDLNARKLIRPEVVNTIIDSIDICFSAQSPNPISPKNAIAPTLIKICSYILFFSMEVISLKGYSQFIGSLGKFLPGSARLPLLGYFMFLQPEFSPTANGCKCNKQKKNKELQARTKVQ